MNSTTTRARRAGIAAFVGTTIEWYDFYVYATAAALVFGPLFFPSGDPLVETSRAFATFAVAFLVRPLGGIIFGHIGDKFGRRVSLVITLLMMGVATVLVGCLPTFADIGIAAPILLIILRALQGLAVGGEWGGAVLMSVLSYGVGAAIWAGFSPWFATQLVAWTGSIWSVIAMFIGMAVIAGVCTRLAPQHSDEAPVTASFTARTDTTANPLP